MASVVPGRQAMLKSRDSQGTGYVLAAIGVAVALVVLIAGASVIAALGVEVPRELWAIGGALTGALVGILVPMPRSRRTGALNEPLPLAHHAVNESKNAVLKAAKAVVDVDAQAGGANAQAAVSGARGASRPAETQARETSERAGARSAIVVAAEQARNEMTALSDDVWTQLEPLERSGKSVERNGKSVADGLPVRSGVVQLLAAQSEKLNDAEKAWVEAEESAPDGSGQKAEEEKAKIGVYQAGVSATERVLESAPTEESAKANLLIFTQAKIVVPATLFFVTALLALLLGLGVVHGRGPCRPLTEQFAEKSACAYYTAFGAQAANVLLSLAAASLGALVGIFAARPGEGPQPLKPSGAS